MDEWKQPEETDGIFDGLPDEKNRGWKYVRSHTVLISFWIPSFFFIMLGLIKKIIFLIVFKAENLLSKVKPL